MATNDLPTNLELIDQYTRDLEDAVTGAQATTLQHERFIRGAASETIDTDQGPIKSLTGQIEDWKAGADVAVADQLALYDIDFSDRLEQYDSDVDDYLITLGFQQPVEYEAGITITKRSQTVSYNGDIYYWAGTLPFTTSGTFENDVDFDFAPLLGGVKAPNFSFSQGGILFSKIDSVLGTDGQWYYWDGSYPKLIPSGSTVESSGGLGEGLFKTSSGFINVRPSLDTMLSDTGHVLNENNFEIGATLVSNREILLEANTGKVYKWLGSIPKVVSMSSTPASSGGLGANSWVEFKQFIKFFRFNEILSSLQYDIAGNFVEGGLISNKQQIILDTDNKIYKWTGSLPKSFSSSDDPSVDPNWVEYKIGDERGLGFMGDWLSSSSVVAGQTWKHNGSTWRALVTTTSEPFIGNSNWELIDSEDLNWGDRLIGHFAKGFTYSETGQVGKGQDGNYYTYVGVGAPNKVVTTGTVPSEPDYKQVFYNSAEQVFFDDDTNLQEFKDNLSSDQVINARSGTVDDRLVELSSANYGVFKSPANLGHNIGSFLYAKTGVNSAHMVTDLTGYYPAAYDVDLSNYVERGLKAYFVEAGAIGTCDSLADPIGSIADAIAKPDVDVIFVKNGVYGIRSNFNAATPLRDVIIKSLYGKATITTIDEDGVWSDNLDGTYTHTLPSGSVDEVYDLEDTVNVDDLGYLIQLTEVNTLSECKATEGTWFRNGSTAVVHRRSAGVPTNNTVYCLRSSPIGFRDFSTKVYFEGFKTFGGQNGGMTIDNATGIYKGFNNDYLYGTGSSGDSFNAFGSYLVINENCLAAAGEKDGFNYHNNANRETHAIEINCKGIGNRTFGTGNGTTAHEDCRVIRLGGQYSYNNGPGIVDIGSVKCLNVACSSSNNRNDPNSKGFLFTETVEAWCDGGNATKNRTADFETQNSAIMHIRDANYGVYRELSSIPFDSDFS